MLFSILKKGRLKNSNGLLDGLRYMASIREQKLSADLDIGF